MKKYGFPYGVAVLAALWVLGGSPVAAQNQRSEKETPPESTQIKILDSTEAQWGRRSVNDSVYLGYPVNMVYQERGRQRLPETFRMYQPEPIDHSNIVQKTRSESETGAAGESEPPTRIRMNGTERSLER